MEIENILDIDTNDRNAVVEKIFELLKEKDALIDEIFINKENLANEEAKEYEYECKVWLETDFQAKKCTNKETREAYVKNEMKDFISHKAEYSRNIKRAESKHALYTAVIKLLYVFLESESNDS